MRQLGRAFARALPAAALPGDGWLKLPIGGGATSRVTLTLDPSGRLQPFEFGDAPVPRPLQRLLRRAHLLLERGRFAIGDEVGAGSETYALRIEVSDGPASDELFVEPGHIMRRGFEPPEPDRSGRAQFAFASGRHVVIHIEVLSVPGQASAQ